MQKALHPVDQEISFKYLWQILYISVQTTFLQNTRFLDWFKSTPERFILNQFFAKLITKCYYSYKNTFHVGNVGLQRSLIYIPLIYYFHTTDSVFWCSAIMRTGR